MSRPRKYPEELLERGVRLALESERPIAHVVLVCAGNTVTPASIRASSAALVRLPASYFVLAAYIAVESLRDLVGGYEPGISWVGIGLAAVTAPTMPLLARAKQSVGHKLNSSATVSEAEQNMICAYLSIALRRRSTTSSASASATRRQVASHQ